MDISQGLPIKKVINYEYMVTSTPQYCFPVSEEWVIVNVFLKYLENGMPTNVLVFRRIVKE